MTIHTHKFKITGVIHSYRSRREDVQQDFNNLLGDAHASSLAGRGVLEDLKVEVLPAKAKSTKAEVSVLLEDGTWSTHLVRIPRWLAGRQSQDEFIAWVHDSKEGQAWFDPLKGVVAYTVSYWGEY